MNSKRIREHLDKQYNDWLESITDLTVKSLAKRSGVITGGAIVSLLSGQEVNDYDIYFTNNEAALAVAEYYVKEFKKNNKDYTNTMFAYNTKEYYHMAEMNKDKFIANMYGTVESEGIDRQTQHKILKKKFNSYDVNRIGVFVRSDGFAKESDKISDDVKKKKYRPKYISSNAITLTDKVQIITRFIGTPDELHKNYDFVHCMCHWTSWNNEVVLPSRSLEAIINKELIYVGSKYPICSVVRTRKFINRGWHINAGQYAKMSYQISELNLNDMNVMEEQLTGVDSFYFNQAIRELRMLQAQSIKDNTELKFDSTYFCNLINKIFDD